MKNIFKTSRPKQRSAKLRVIINNNLAAAILGSGLSLLFLQFLLPAMSPFFSFILGTVFGCAGTAAIDMMTIKCRKPSGSARTARYDDFIIEAMPRQYEFLINLKFKTEDLAKNYFTYKIIESSGGFQLVADDMYDEYVKLPYPQSETRSITVFDASDKYVLELAGGKFVGAKKVAAE